MLLFVSALKSTYAACRLSLSSFISASRNPAAVCRPLFWSCPALSGGRFHWYWDPASVSVLSFVSSLRNTSLRKYISAVCRPFLSFVVSVEEYLRKYLCSLWAVIPVFPCIEWAVSPVLGPCIGVSVVPRLRTRTLRQCLSRLSSLH